MSSRVKTAIGVTAYLLAAVFALWRFDPAALVLVMIGTFGGAMIYKAEADDAQELVEELLKLHYRLLDDIKDSTDQLITLDDVRELLDQEAENE